MLMTSNCRLKVKLQGDVGAWRRRMLSHAGETFSLGHQSPNVSILSPTGHLDWAVFTAWDEQNSKGKIQAAPLRVLHGDHWATHKGYGKIHIEAEHAAEIAVLNISVDEFIHHTLLDFNEVYQDGDRLTLLSSRPSAVAVVELRKNEGGFYSVVTAFPKKNPSWRPRGVRILGGRKAAFAQSVSAPARTAQGITGPKPPLETLAGKDSWQYLASLRERVKQESKSLPAASGETMSLTGPQDAAGFQTILLDRIGEEALRVEQPGAKYEDKRQLLLDFSKSILGPAQKGLASDSTARLRALSVLAQKFAQKLATDLQVRFIGDTIGDTAGLVMRAQALRNPLFETFYLLGMDGSTLKGAMAVTSRIPCSAMIHETGQNWATGSDAHAEFLTQCGASEYYLLHNHPSGDPSPSGRDIQVTQRHALEMDKRGFAMREHIVINHLTYTSIDRTGRASGGELL